MPTAENAKLEYEAGQTFNAFEALTDSGDNTTFNSSGELWSKRSGFTPEVKPNGLVNGAQVSAAVANDTVSATAATCNLLGVETTVVADAALVVTRGATTDTHIINSITINAGGAYAVITGTATTAHSETRGVAGTAAPVTSDEIFSVPGVHTEWTNLPLYDIDYANGDITFNTALPAIHTGDLPKGVYAQFYEPIFAEVPLATDFVPTEESHSTTSIQAYGKTIASSSSSLNQASFTAFNQDGVTDSLVTLKNQILWFRFYPDKYKTPHILDQGKLGIARTFPASSELQAACTISSEAISVDRAS